ncbi:NAD dependent epimerase/dehydratase family protein, partial [Vibrio parahaemolyticus EKP-028]
RDFATSRHRRCR